MKKIVLVIAVSIVIASCVHPPLETAGPTISSICNPDTVYFQHQILPLLQSNCTMSGCHNAQDKKEGIDLSTYASIMKTGGIKIFQANKSELVEVLTETDPDKIMPRPPMLPLTATQINLIKTWINQGAKNNACLSCDTSITIKYSEQIQGLMQANCTGCHNSNLSSGGIVLENYTQVKSVVDNGKLLGSIKHLNGYSPMPQGSKLSDCNIAIIEKWINNGALNN